MNHIPLKYNLSLHFPLLFKRNVRGMGISAIETIGFTEQAEQIISTYHSLFIEPLALYVEARLEYENAWLTTNDDLVVAVNNSSTVDIIVLPREIGNSFYSENAEYPSWLK
jgi:hypothetical protein